MKKFFRIFVDSTPAVHFDFPNDGGMGLEQFISQMLISGYIMHPTFYVRHSSVKYVLPIEMEVMSVVPFRPTVVN